MTNNDIARRLLNYARELESEGGNVYRVRSYRVAAQSVERMNTPIEDVLKARGRSAIESIPGVGKSLAYTIVAIVEEGETKTVKPIDATREPERLFTSLPGVGQRLAEDFRDKLGISTLDELYDAARAGRLSAVGVGAKRLAGILAALEQRASGPRIDEDEPSIEDLLSIDAEYLDGMERESLPRLAGKYTHPDGEAMLGIHLDERNGWKLKAMFSNTALAHRLGCSRDWVVVYFEQGEISGQRTVVTEMKGDLAGLRVVRGRERECRMHYNARPQTSEPAA